MWKLTGHGKHTAFLRRSLETRSLSHAYLFVGPAHIGKMTLALNLASALNCRGDGPPCGECDSCLKIIAGKHADVQVTGLNGGEKTEESKQHKEIGIDRIRDEVQHSASLPPFEGDYKVFIIDGAERLSLEAANCLLKTLEEPEKKVVFILLTANERLLPETVVSRCLMLKLTPVPVAEIKQVLTGEMGVEQEKAVLLARLSHGCPGWAISAAGDESLLRQRTDWLDEVTDIIDAGAEERFAYAARMATRFGQDREAVFGVLDLWLDLWRDLLLVKADAPDNIANIDRLETLSGIAGSYSLVQIREFIKNIQAAAEQLRLNVNPRLVMEVLMLELPEAAKRQGVKSAA
jgi:DNA polymerase-3 subunit delta'